MINATMLIVVVNRRGNPIAKVSQSALEINVPSRQPDMPLTRSSAVSIVLFTRERNRRISRTLRDRRAGLGLLCDRIKGHAKMIHAITFQLSLPVGSSYLIPQFQCDGRLKKEKFIPTVSDSPPEISPR